MFAPPVERQCKTGVFPVKAHFRHFPTKNKEEAAACERRVSKMTPAEKEKIKRSATSQRARLFRRWFWSILEAHLIRSDLDPVKRDVIYGRGDYEGYKATGLLAEALDAFQECVPSIYGTACEFLDSICLRQAENLESEDLGERFGAHVTGNGEDDDLTVAFYQRVARLSKERLHREIVREALLFLGAKNNRQILESLFFYWLIGSCVGDIKDESEMIHWALIKIGEMIALIPWYDEFERIQKGGDLPEPEKGFIGLIHAYITNQQMKVLAAGLNTSALAKTDEATVKAMTKAERIKTFGGDPLEVLGRSQLE